MARRKGPIITPESSGNYSTASVPGVFGNTTEAPQPNKIGPERYLSGSSPLELLIQKCRKNPNMPLSLEERLQVMVAKAEFNDGNEVKTVAQIISNKLRATAVLDDFVAELNNHKQAGIKISPGASTVEERIKRLAADMVPELPAQEAIINEIRNWLIKEYLKA